MTQSHDDNDGLKLITTLKGDCGDIEVRSATGRFRGDIYFIDSSRPDEWLMSIHAKQLVSLMCHPAVYPQIREYLK